MISVCIPVYNYNVIELAKELSSQAVKASVPVEVVFLDDGSEKSVLDMNRAVQSFEKVRFYEQKNRGRSASRNRLAELSKGEYLIFMDADCGVADNFVQKYVTNLKEGCVLAGGLEYGPRPKEASQVLRWKVGINREVRSLRNRLKNPYAHFLTSNFMIPKRIMEVITFEEMLGGYGHEDTLFGYALQEAKIEVVHIDNPVIHLGIDDSDLYLFKIEQSIDNLIFLLKEDPHRKDFTLLRYYQVLKRMRLTSLFCWIFKPLDGWITKMLSSKYAQLILLDIYKMRLLIEKMKSSEIF